MEERHPHESHKTTQRCDVRNLNRAFVDASWDIFQHHWSALHELIKVPTKANEAIHIRMGKKLFDFELIKEFQYLVDWGAQSGWVVEKIRFEWIRVHIWPEF